MTSKEDYPRGKLVTLRLLNNTGENIELETDCPEEPFDVFKYENGEWVQINAVPEIECQATTLTLIPNKKTQVLYDKWKHALFSELGRYKITIDYNEKTYESNEFEIEEAGVLRLFWTRMLYQPIYNTLLLISKYLWWNLGLGIILLTFIIRLILLIPSQRALKQQKKMQMVQPKLEAIKRKHAGDQQKIAQETMAIWKEHRVNPFGSCMPLLVQFPILIALFYVIRDGLNPDNTHLLYESFQNINLHDITTNFFGILELTKRNIFWLPLSIGALQFFQMKLTMAKKKTTDKKGKKEEKSEMAMANNMMIYFMPVMIAVFAASLPAGVGLYWGTSTLFGIGQQLVVNKEMEGETKVKVKNVKDKK